MGNRHCAQIVQVAVAAQGQTFLNEASHKVKVSLFTASGKPDFAIHEEPEAGTVAEVSEMVSLAITAVSGLELWVLSFRGFKAV